LGKERGRERVTQKRQERGSENCSEPNEKNKAKFLLASNCRRFLFIRTIENNGTKTKLALGTSIYKSVYTQAVDFGRGAGVSRTQKRGGWEQHKVSRMRCSKHELKRSSCRLQTNLQKNLISKTD